MKMILYVCKCLRCCKDFKFPQFSGDAYGEFLLIDEYGEMVYLNSFDDVVYSEVSKIFDGLVPEYERKKIDFDRALFFPVLSVTCDLSSTNAVYEMRHPPCPNCHQSSFTVQHPIEPKEFIDLDIPNATHHAWNKLSDFEKKALVEKVINKTRMETRQALIDEMRLFISDLDSMALKNNFEIKLQKNLINYLTELLKFNNENKIKSSKKIFGDFYRDYYFKNFGGLDWNDPLLQRCSKITDLGLKNGL